MSFNRNRRGFSLVELVIVVVIVGLLAAIAIPRFSRGAAGATDSAIAGDLTVLRNAIELYAAEHNGKFPAAATLANQLTLYSKADGSTSATKTGDFVYGTYLHKLPPLKAGTYAGNSGIEAVTSTPTAEVTTDGVGYLYNASTGQIWANETDYLGY